MFLVSLPVHWAGEGGVRNPGSFSAPVQGEEVPPGSVQERTRTRETLPFLILRTQSVGSSKVSVLSKVFHVTKAFLFYFI